MAGKTYTIDIDVEIKKLTTSVNQANESLENLSAQGKKAAAAVGRIDDSAKQTAGSVQKIGRAFSTVGVAVRTVLASGMLKLVDASIEFFQQLQPVLDLVNGINNSLSFAVKNIDELVSGSMTWEQYTKGITTAYSELTNLQKQAVLNEAMLAGLQQQSAANMTTLMTAMQGVNNTYEDRKALIDEASKNEKELFEVQKNNIKAQLSAIRLQQKGDEDNVELKAKQIQLENELLNIENEHKNNITDLNNLYDENNLRVIEQSQTRLDADLAYQDSQAMSLQQLRERYDLELEWTKSHMQQLENVQLENTELYAQLKKREYQITREYEQKKKEITIATAQASLNAVGAVFGALAEASAGNFETQKKFKIAEATVNTIQGMVTAFTGAMQLGPIAGPIVGAVLAAAVGVMGYMNIDKIKNTKPESGGSMGSASVPNISTPQQGGAPGFGLINPLTSGEASISSAFDTAQQPIQAYVVSSHVSSQQELDRNIVANAEI